MHVSASRRLPLFAFGLILALAPATFAQTPARTLTDAQRKKARYHMDFDKVDILEVIKYISQWTNKNFILPDNVRGKITIIGPSDVTADEAYAAFLAALETNNLTVTPSGRFLKIVPKKDAIRTDIPTFLNGGEMPDDERMVTRLFRLRFTESDPIKNVLQQFITREGEIVPYPPDVLIISDTALNIRRIDRLLGQLDLPGSQDEINVMQVENASAQELANMLLQIFQPQAGAAAPGARRSTLAAAPREPGAAATSPAESGGGGTVTKIIPDERTNKIIVIAPAKAFQRIRELVKKLDAPTDTGQVHVYYLENADAEELASTLGALASGTGATTAQPRRARTAGTPPPTAAPAGATSAALFSGEVKVTADKGTNALLITASPADFRNMVRVIEKLDIRRRQVFIEAVIMEVKINNENRFSLDAHGGHLFTDVQVPGSGKSTVPLVFGSEVSNPAASLNLATVASLSGFLAGVQGPPIKLESLGISLPSFGVLLNALQKNSDVNVISTPHILTSDNEEAEIAVGSNVPFQAAYAPSLSGIGLGTTTGTTSASSLLGGLGGLGLGSLFAPIQRQPVELRLKLKPQINESDNVKLVIDEQVEEISSVDRQLGPTTAKRSIKTTVVTRDQSTVVIGGLIQDRTTRAVTRVPILGSIPIIGKLFSAESEVREKTNLLLFLTPYVIRDQEDFRRIFERKMKERQEFLARFFGSSEQYQVTIDYARKRGPLGVLRENVLHEFSKVENGGPGAPGERVVTPEDEAPVEMPPGFSPGTVPPSEQAPGGTLSAPDAGPDTGPAGDASGAEPE